MAINISNPFFFSELICPAESLFIYYGFKK